MDRFTRWLGDLSARHPWRTVISWVVVAVSLMVLSSSVGGAFVDDFSAPGSESATAQDLLEERFPEAAGGSGFAVFAAPAGQRIDASRAAIGEALQQVRGAEHVASVGDPFAAGHVSRDGRIAYADLTLDIPAADLGAEGAEDLAAALAAAREAGVQAELGGDVAFYNKKDEAGSEGFGLLAALIVLLLVFGTVTAALIPIALAGVGVAAALGAVGLLASGMDVSTAAPTFGVMIGLGVGIDYSLFVIARYREARAAGVENRAALSAAMASSGTAVFFAGATVVIALAALALTGLSLLASIGLSASIVVLFAAATALTLLPAILTLLGDRIDRLRLRPRRQQVARPVQDTSWWRLAHRISARPWPYLIGATVLLLALAAPALSLKSGFPDPGGDAKSTTQRKAYDLLTQGFGAGFNAPMVLVTDLTTPNLPSLSSLTQKLKDDPGIATVAAPVTNSTGDTTVIQFRPTTGPSDRATYDTVHRLRDALPTGASISGPTALTLDLDKQLSDTLPLFVGAILLASFLLLVLVFRSIAVPLKAAAMNLLSIGAAYGVVVAVFQWGWFGGLLGLDGTYRVVSVFPTLFFAVLFGLSMDYEVFLVSRIRDAYNHLGDNTEAVAQGLAATGRIITSGALIMVFVFLSFVTNPDPSVKMIGLGLATAIAIDATVVRMVLVPATMALLGDRNWWLPGWMERRLPNLHVEGADVAQIIDVRDRVTGQRRPAEGASVPAVAPVAD